VSVAALPASIRGRLAATTGVHVVALKYTAGRRVRKPVLFSGLLPGLMHHTLPTSQVSPGGCGECRCPERSQRCRFLTPTRSSSARSRVAWKASSRELTPESLLARPAQAGGYRKHLEGHLLETPKHRGDVFRSRLATWRGLVEQDFWLARVAFHRPPVDRWGRPKKSRERDRNPSARRSRDPGVPGLRGPRSGRRGRGGGASRRGRGRATAGERQLRSNWRVR
jgi:hypothetical protein